MNTLENIIENCFNALGKFLRPEQLFLGLLFVLGGLSIILFNTQVFPVNPAYALFYFFLLVLLGLYRPALLWQAVIFFLAFELVTAVELGGAAIRIYQFGTMALLLASILLLLQGKVILPRFRWFDIALVALLVGAILSFFANSLPVESSKQLLVLVFFGFVYGAGRLYVRSKQDWKNFLVTLQVSGVVVALYALYQAVAFKYQQAHFMVMEGRPNSVFEEADWLGFFLGVVALIAIFRFLQTRKIFSEVLAAILVVLFVLTLILTVSRSAWLGFAAGVIFVILCMLLQYFSGFLHTKKSDYRTLGKLLAGIPFLLALSIFLVSLLGLTRFDLDQRALSTASGNQEITIACSESAHSPAFVQFVEELGSLGCQHIDLEEREAYLQDGYEIRTTERPDPNIDIRQDLYRQSFTLLKEHPVFGIGWGESLKAFGTDGRGAGLNSSNMFLEVWLGTGLLGILGFSFFWFGLLIAGLKRLFRKREMTDGFWITLLVLTLWIHVTIFNLFNSGLLLGTFGAFLILASWYLEKAAPRIKNLWQK